ncbi:VOC family protein [soil metagenome]
MPATDNPPLAPYLMVNDGVAAIAWYERAFGAVQGERYDMDDGRVGHVTLAINGGTIMLSDEFPEFNAAVGTQSPVGLGGTTVTLNLTVDEVDPWFDRAVAAGAEAIRPATDEFYGRHGKLRDPFGHVWSITGPKSDA